MTYFSSLVVSGLLVGALYGLVGMGFAVIFKVSRVVNFAQGEVLMLIAYVAYLVASRTGGNAALTIVAVIAMAVASGFLIERVVIRPMLARSTFAIVMMTIALAVLLRSLVALIWGSDPMRFPDMRLGNPGALEFLGATIQPAQLTLAAVFGVSVVAIQIFLRFSIVGIAMRATAADPMVVLLMGVSASRLYRWAWVVSAALAGVAGVLYANIYNIGLEMAYVGIRAFPATILGGLDSIGGAAIGGLIIGVVENLVGGYLGSGYRDIAGFVVILAVLMLRPHGLLGEEDIERV